uniref:Catalytic n=1 Tax=Rhizophora mucronata TaxID=61149 RepID=A0A2P2LET9_RHIMU
MMFLPFEIRIFDIWCLHIPVKDRTSFTGLVKLIERTVRSESNRSPNRPIYLVGESLGACLALAVATHNPNVDLVLILSNPGTSFKKSQLQTLIPLLEFFSNQYQIFLPYMLNLMKGDSLRIAMDDVLKGLPLQQTVGRLSEDVVTIPSYLSVLTTILPRETFLWKLQMLQSASAYVNSRLHAIRAQALILTSGKDQLLPSQEEGERLHDLLLKCESRTFEDKGHFLFLEDNVDLVSTIKATSFYRRGKLHDYVSDYIMPTASEFKKEYESNRWLLLATSPVMLSTCEDGKVVKGLAGVPSEGPVLFVGYHMLLGFELAPLVLLFLLEKNVLLRGIAHSTMFSKLKGGIMPDISQFDVFRLMGAVPVSGTHFFKLLSSKSHVLLYPGGVREACHRKGEQYQLFWPERSEFVRMAARFGAKIVPFGVVGEDDFAEVVFDYNDQLKTPFLGDYINSVREETKSVRTQFEGEVGNQDMHLPGMLPKFPGRFYYYFGRPIQTEGRKKELRDREKAHELYLQVKSEVEKCLAFLKEKREEDPYRNILARLAYQATHGVTSKIPTFEL